MNDLRKIFSSHEGNTIHKWDHYFEIYDRYFSRYRGKAPVILEIGVYKGGSLQMWQKYFGPDAKIYGVDINPLCKQFEAENVEIFIGSQEDRNFLTGIKQKIGKVDILIDDGGHSMRQLKTTFEELYDLVDDNGIYLAEDLHTCYWYQYGGGLNRKSNFIEHTKKMVDVMHQWYYKPNKVDLFAKCNFAIHFYDSIVVFEKRKIPKPFDIRSGKLDVQEVESHAPRKGITMDWIKYMIHRFTSINIP